MPTWGSCNECRVRGNVTRSGVRDTVRHMRIGYGRAARIIDQLHYAGLLGPPDGSKPREVLVGFDQLDEYCK